MKLATYRDGSRDGQLLVVSRDLCTAHYASGIATRLQQVLDDWNFLSPQLEDLSQSLNQGKPRHAFVFEPAKCAAPLPRAYQWLEPASRQAREDGQGPSTPGIPGTPDPPGTPANATPALLPCGSDGLLGACDDIVFPGPDAGFEFEPALAAITGDIEPGVAPGSALDGVRLLMLAGGLRLRRVTGADSGRDPSGAHARLTSTLAPVAVTPDELGAAWQGGRVQLSLQARLNGRRAPARSAGAGMAFHFGELIAEAARWRGLHAGAIVGSGAIGSAAARASAASDAAEPAAGSGHEDLSRSIPLSAGDKLRLEMSGIDGLSVFGAIAVQGVVPR